MADRSSRPDRSPNRVPTKRERRIIAIRVNRRWGPDRIGHRSGRGGEIQLTDALQTLADSDAEGAGVYGVIFHGNRYDTGDKLSYLKAVVKLASEREDLGPDLRTWLREFADSGA